MTSRELTAAEAAARLGVKRETLYTYVSRGLVHRHMAMDGRTSLFDSDEIDAFRSRRRRQTEGEVDTVIATAVAHVRDGWFRLAGHDVVGLVADDIDYEDVVELVWGGGAGSWDLDRAVEDAIRTAQDALPVATTTLDRIRVTTAVVSALDPQRFDMSPGGVRTAGRGLLPAMVAGLPLLGRDVRSGRMASRLWPRLTARRPTAERRAALNAAMALLTDHGLAASTFGVRVAASVRADPYSVVGAGLGVLGGTLHGAASSSVHLLLEHAHSSGDPAAAVGDAYRRHGLNPGFGHAVYESQDPRYPCLMTRVSAAWAGDPRLGTIQVVRDLIGQRTDAIPNVDLALGSLTWLADMGPEAGEAVFAIARTAGWLAHALEEYEEKPLRFRPRARYIGVRDR